MFLRFVLMVTISCAACSLTVDEWPGALAEDEEDQELVEVDEVKSLAIQYQSLALPLGEKVDLEVVATYGDDSTEDVTAQVAWTVEDPDIASVSQKGVLKGKTEGQTHVVASLVGMESDPLTVNVTGSPLPDLYISAMSAYGTGGGAILDVTVTNVGSTKATEFWLDIFVDPTGTPTVGDVGITYSWVEKLSAGESMTYEFALNTGFGLHQLYALADPTGDVEEADEDNNVASTSVQVGNSGGPDLTVTGFTSSCDYYNDIHYDVTVENLGDATTGDVYVDMFVDEWLVGVGDDGDERQTINGMSAGASVILQFVLPSNCMFCDSWAYVDIDNTVAETDETNNDYWATVYVPL